MKNFPVEILIALAFVGMVLLNYLAQRSAARRRQQEEALAQAEPPPAADEPLADYWGRTPASAAAPVFVPRPAPPPVQAVLSVPLRAHPVRALLQNRRGLRRAIILMTVLGPCRAEEPPER